MPRLGAGIVNGGCRSASTGCFRPRPMAVWSRLVWCRSVEDASSTPPAGRWVAGGGTVTIGIRKSCAIDPEATAFAPRPA
ncbi:MAG: hypothetical protein IPG97_07100 [Microthrixaceae bacterium]|nr:hypothetical protein [Microthrixaceae bacterium]